MIYTIKDKVHASLLYKKFSSTLKTQKNRYIIATIAILIILLGSQFYINTLIVNLEKDGTVINLAGSQRMRSQRVTQLSLRLVNNENIRGLLKNENKQFQKNHTILLKGDANLKIPKCEIQHIQQELNKVTNYVTVITNNVENLYNERNNSLYIKNILLAQEEFLPIMDNIVKLFEVEYSRKLGNFQIVEASLTYGIVAIIAFEAFLIFIPGYKKIKTNIEWLTEAESILRTVENTVIITDSKGVATWTNEAFTKLTGYSPYDLIGKKPGDLLQGELTSKETIEKIRHGLTTKAPFYVEIINYHKHGLPYWVNLQITPVLNNQGEVEKFISVQSNITERKNAEDRIKKANFILEDTNKQLDEQKEELNQQAFRMAEFAEEINNKHEKLKVQSLLLEKHNKQITESINYAKRIQNAVTSDGYILEKYFSEYFVYNKPKDIVSGDFFWSSKIGNTIYIVVADCTGHGVPGAIMSTIGINLLDRITGVHKVNMTNLILQTLQFELKKLLQKSDNSINDGMDIGIVSINLEERKLFYSGAFHNLYFSTKSEKNKITVIRGDRFGIGGIYADNLTLFDIHSLNLNDIHRFYMLTDGVKDQFGNNITPVSRYKDGKMNPLERKFSQRRIISILEENSHKSMNEISESFDSYMKQWIGERRQTDDMLMVGIELPS